MLTGAHAAELQRCEQGHTLLNYHPDVPEWCTHAALLQYKMKEVCLNLICKHLKFMNLVSIKITTRLL